MVISVYETGRSNTKGVVKVLRAVKKFPESWYCTVTVGNAETLIQPPSQKEPCARAHWLHGSCHCWKPLLKASVGIFRSSALSFHLVPPPPHGGLAGPLEAQFQSREHPKVTGSEVRRVRWLEMCGSVRYVEPLPLSRRHGHMVHRTVGVEESRELFDCPLDVSCQWYGQCSSRGLHMNGDNCNEAVSARFGLKKPM
jgi:hypothetical protein